MDNEKRRGYYVFFFQAEDGIRDVAVTGVQTCALPILGLRDPLGEPTMHLARDDERVDAHAAVVHRDEIADAHASGLAVQLDHRHVSAEGIDELRRTEELARLEPGVDVGRELARLGAGRDLGEAEGATGHALHLQATVGIGDVHGRRLEQVGGDAPRLVDRKSTRLNSSHGYISYAVFCLKKKKN